MSVELDWKVLDQALTDSTVNFLTSALGSANKPNFIGDIHVSDFSFGDSQPSIQLLDVRDIFKEFLLVDDDDEDQLLHQRAEQDSVQQASSSSSGAPSLQLHLRVTYTGNMQVGLATSLLINYPSPAFMALPLKLQVTSLAFTGTFIVAYEGDRRRVHISLLDPRTEDPIPTTTPSPPPTTSPLSSSLDHNHPTSTSTQQSTTNPQPTPTPTATSTSSASHTTTNSSTSPFFPDSHNSIYISRPGLSSSTLPSRSRMSAGSCLLTGAVVESEVGQAEKHVLKNVGKVEKFVLDVARSSLESELVFPNFQTILF
ncbi:hypothetical protein T439DRAFT_377227 [Meredithblackwellia eburnea MCA 4105]